MNQSALDQLTSLPAGKDASSVTLADMVLDRAEVEGVWDRGFAVCPQRFINYLSSPYEEGSIWVYRPDGESIHGAIGLHAQRLSLGGRIHNVGQIGNLAVDTRFRSVGPAVRLQRALLASLAESDRTLIFGITSKAVHVLRRAGCKPVGTAQRWVKILKSENQLKKRVRPALLAKAAAPAVDLGMRLVSRETFSRLPADVSVGIVRSFDERFDRLWERVAARFPIATQRTSEYLTWRFHSEEDSPYQTLWVADSKGELAGYVVFELRGDAVVEVADLMFDGQLGLGCLLNAFVRRMRSSEFRATSISLGWFGQTTHVDQLRSFGFRQRSEDLQTFVYADAETLNDLGSQLFDTEQWYLTGADTDL
jgi:hypothetical protein